LKLAVGYRFVGAPEKNAPWYRAGGGDFGIAGETVLGNQIGGNVAFTPWEPLSFVAEYAAFILGTTRAGEDVLHYGGLEARVRFPTAQ
jgi:hypothetical protein